METTATQATMALEQAHTSGVYPKRPVVITRGQGARVWDEEGREYIDATSGQGVALLGHAHSAVARALYEQAQTLITCPEIFYNDRRAQLMSRLTALAPGGLNRVFLCNSGTEAIEGALKFARVATGRKGVVATMRGFHGRTMGALSATWEPKYREPFQPLIPGFSHVPYDNLEAAAGAIGPDTAAVLVEPVQGEGGVRPASPGYLLGLQRLCDERGALLILDEIQTGLGRTGRWFACQHTGVVPDLMALAKGLAGGVPMGAVLMGPRVGELPSMSHGSTFGGNPLSCAAALATLDVLEKERLPQQAAEKGEYLLGRLRRLESEKIREVRGLGLMVALDLRERVTPYLMALMRRGVLALPAGPTVLRLLPPLVITYEEMDRVVAAIAEVLSQEEIGKKDGSERG
ncbi:MAG: aspartate aminotransferase family protein [Anaerolineae bacterium]|nr:aspartate aminotransferase family protein [Anaerolineae bacterium]